MGAESFKELGVDPFKAYKPSELDALVEAKRQELVRSASKAQVVLQKKAIEEAIKALPSRRKDLDSPDSRAKAQEEVLSIITGSMQPYLFHRLDGTDVFFDEKEYIHADEWHRFCSETVPLARLPKFVYTAGDTLTAKIEIAHFGEEPLERANIIVYLCPEYGVKMKVGHFIKDIPIGSPIPLGNISLPVTDVKEPTKYRLEVLVSGTNFVNDWNVWFYPSEETVDEGDVYVTTTLDDEALRVLDRGGDVLVCAAGKVSYGSDIRQQFLPVFWNTSWFKMRPPHTTGLFINDAHPLFREFPTDYHSDVQWWELVNNAQVMLFSDVPEGFQPLVQSIDTWFLSRKIGMLFEARVGKGRLMMTTMDITSDLERRVVARQMRKAILDYMNSPYFRPTFTVPAATVQDLFTKRTPLVNMFTKQSPDELKPKIN